MENRIDRILILPEHKGDFKAQLNNCLRQVQNYTEWTGSQLLQQSFFINAVDNNSFLEKYGLIKELVTKADIKPSTSIIAQPPATKHEVSVELILLTNPSADLKLSYAEEGGVQYSILSYVSHKEIYAAGVCSVKPFDPFVRQVEDAYSLLEAILKREGMFFSDIARQWNYVEDILSMHDTGEKYVQNYQVLNDVRSLYYARSSFDKGYPAATGIGMSAGGIVLEIFALKPHKEIQIIPVKNPHQIDAYAYSEEVLVGDALENDQKKTTPKFERAKFVGIHSKGQVYISGTASIKDEKIIGEGNVEKQTEISIENIANLIEKNYLERLGVKDIKSIDYRFIRVYIKHAKDVDAVKQLCDAHYSGIPVHYLLSDVCRDSLLVEIEGVIEVS